MSRAQARRNNPNVKLSEDDVRLIRQLYAEGLTGPELAEKFEVSRSTIWMIGTYRIWRHVHD